MDQFDRFLETLPEFLDKARASIEQELEAAKSADAKNPKKTLEDLNIFLNEAQFTPGGVRDAVKAFCDGPEPGRWQEVKRKMNQGNVIQANLQNNIKKIDRNFAARNTDLLRTLGNFGVWKKGQFTSMLGPHFDRSGMPTDPAKIDQLRHFVTACDEQNELIRGVQKRIEVHLDQLADRERNERDRLFGIVAESSKDRASLNLIDVFIILLFAVALDIFLFWAATRLVDRPIFEVLPSFIVQTYSGIWNSLIAASAGFGLALVRAITLRRRRAPNYLLYVLIIAAAIVGIVFAIAFALRFLSHS